MPEQTLVYIESEKDLTDFCGNMIVPLTDINSGYMVPKDIKFFYDLLSAILSVSLNDKTLNNKPKGITIIIENHYVDKAYRNSFYTYFSQRHFVHNRDCRRITVYKGKYKNFLDFLKTDETKISMIGFIVLNPLSGAAIGKTIIDPKYLKKENDFYCRTSEFTISVYGKRCSVIGFPYRKQTEIQSCVETCLLNIFDYYASKYNYRQVLPGDIREYEKRVLHESPNANKGGFSYYHYSRALIEFGFVSKIYDEKSVADNSNALSGISPKEYLRKIMHYYVESGIPVSVNLSPSSVGTGHSLICIGHSCQKGNLKKDEIVARTNYKTKISLIDTADFYDSYVLIDDNQPPVVVREFSKLTEHDNFSVSALAVALYNTISVDACRAKAIFDSIINHETIGIIKNNISLFGKDGYDFSKNPVITRIFLSSSNTFKNFKVRKIAVRGSSKREKEDALIYPIIPFPKFIWVCELYKSFDDYSNAKAFGEIVIDSSSKFDSNPENVIVCNYSDRIAYRPQNSNNTVNMPSKSLVSLGFENGPRNLKNRSIENLTFSGFNKNLTKY
jgi:hypothetical protein